MTYDQLIKKAYSAYAKFLKAKGRTQKLTELFDKIRNYTPENAGDK